MYHQLTTLILFFGIVCAQSVDCSKWYSPQGSEWVTKYGDEVERTSNALRAPSFDAGCKRGFTHKSGTSVTVVAKKGGFFYVKTSSGDWTWLASSAFQAPAPVPVPVPAPVPVPVPAPNPTSCGSWYVPQGADYVSHFKKTTRQRSSALKRPDSACKRGFTIASGTAFTLTAQKGNFYWGESSTGDWTWIAKSAFGVLSPPAPTPPAPTPPAPAPQGKPRNHAENVALIKASRHRNTNQDGSAYTKVPSSKLPINNFLVSWRDYERAGGITWPIPNAGNFRVYCEFSHFAYDDPIVFPNKPGATHLHMFFGNTEANAYSTANTILNSGSSTCNGEELNRSAYWVPALIDQNGNAVVPDDVLVYYKGYYGPDSKPGKTVVYPPGMKLVSGNAKATSAQPGHKSHRELFFRCYKPGTGGDNKVNTKHTTIPSCGGDRRLEMNVKFQTCWNGQGPGDYKRNAAYSDVWPTSGSCPSSHPIKLPQLEYRVYFHSHSGSAGWILSSDVQGGRIRGRGYSLHGDWFGGWNKNINQQWINKCVNVQGNDCDEGLLDDPRKNPNAKGLKIRKPYYGSKRIPGRALLDDLCTTGKKFTGQASVALCT